MHMYKYLALVLCLLFAGNGVANTNQYDHFNQYPYVGIGFSALDGDIDGVGSFNNSMLGVIAGYRFHPNFAGEVRGYGNISDDELYGVNIEIENSFSLLGKALFPAGQYLDLYGVLGFGTTSAELSANGYSASDSDEDFQYGFGAAFNKGNELELQLEWIRSYDDDGLTLDGFNLNLVYRL